MSSVFQPLNPMTRAIPSASLNDGQQFNPWLGKYGQNMTSDLFARYTECMLRGNVFSATTLVAGTAIPVNTTTAPTFILWNPADSKKIVIPISFRAGFASGTGIAGAIGYNKLTGTGGASGSGGGTTATLTAFTDIVPQSCLIGSSFTCSARFATTSTIVTTNATFFRASGISQGAPITSTALYWSLLDVFDGAVGLMPGNAIYPVANTAIAEVTQMSMEFVELPQ